MPEIKSENLEQDPEEQEAEQYVFYNVMPKVGTAGPMVSPTLTIKQTETGSSTPGMGNLKSLFANKNIVIGTIIGVILIVGFGIFAYFKWIKAPEIDTTPLSNHSVKKATQDKDPAESEAITTPEDWRKEHFGNCSDEASCKDSADPDQDGLKNIEEHDKGTDPVNRDSDQDGLADGDEVHVFETDPLKDHSGKNAQYSDLDNIKGGYNPATDQKYTEAELADIKQKLDKFQLHLPTVANIDEKILKDIYKFGVKEQETEQPATSSTTPTSTNISNALPDDIDKSQEAKLDRDTQRSETIQKTGIALTKYYEDRKEFPKTNLFSDMYAAVKPYMRAAPKGVDPINKEPYLYGYSRSDDGKDFTLSYFSETSNSLIKKHLQDALKDRQKEESTSLDDQRERDLESLRTALLLYSANTVKADSSVEFNFPTQDNYKSELLTKNYIASIPKDPKTGLDYEYRVANTFDSFTLKAQLDDPPNGRTGLVCNQEEDPHYY